MAVHLWRKGTSLPTVMNKVAYEGAGIIPSKHLGWKNLMTNIPFLPHEELALQSRRAVATVRRLLLCREQKNVNWMMDIGVKFTKAGKWW